MVSLGASTVLQFGLWSDLDSANAESGGLGEMPGASVRNPARDKVMRKEADIRKACSDFRGPSGNS